MWRLQVVRAPFDFWMFSQPLVARSVALRLKDDSDRRLPGAHVHAMHRAAATTAYLRRTGEVRWARTASHSAPYSASPLPSCSHKFRPNIVIMKLCRMGTSLQ